MSVHNCGSALRYCLPQMVGRKLGQFWELIKPLVDFKYEVRPSEWSSDDDVTQVIETRTNSMFELATTDEIDKEKF